MMRKCLTSMSLPERHKRSFRPLWFSKQTVNMIFIVELPEGESSQEHETTKTLSKYQTIMIVPYAGVQHQAPQVLMVVVPHSEPQHDQFQEDIVEEVSDEEIDQRATRVKRGKRKMEESIPIKKSLMRNPLVIGRHKLAL